MTLCLAARGEQKGTCDAGEGDRRLKGARVGIDKPNVVRVDGGVYFLRTGWQWRWMGG